MCLYFHCFAGQGKDAIFGDEGDDVLLGDDGFIVRALEPAWRINGQPGTATCNPGAFDVLGDGTICEIPTSGRVYRTEPYLTGSYAEGSVSYQTRGLVRDTEDGQGLFTIKVAKLNEQPSGGSAFTTSPLGISNNTYYSSFPQPYAGTAPPKDARNAATGAGYAIWHRDIVLEDLAMVRCRMDVQDAMKDPQRRLIMPFNVTGVTLDPTRDGLSTPFGDTQDSECIMSSELMLLGTVYGLTDTVRKPFNGSAAPTFKNTVALGMKLVPAANDIINGAWKRT